MTGAPELIDKIRTELKPLHQQIVEHRYPAALENRRLSRAALATFAIQQHHIIASDLRSIAMLLARHGNLPSRPYLVGVLQGENTAFEALAKFAEALGMTDDALRASEPIPAAFAYSAFVAWLGLYGSDAELAGAFTVNFAAWGHNCGRMRTALKTGYGLKPEAVSFFDLFADLPLENDAAIAVIQAGLDRGVSPAAVARAARMLQRYELMYWDSMAEAAGV